MFTFQQIFHSFIFSHIIALIDSSSVLIPTSKITIFDYTKWHLYETSTHCIKKYRKISSLIKNNDSIELKEYQSIKRNLILFPFSFSQTAPEIHSELVDTLKTFSYAILVDYRVPERNLDIPSFVINYGLFFCTAKKGFSFFQTFIKKNAIEGIIYTYSLNSILRKTICAGSITILCIQNIK